MDKWQNLDNHNLLELFYKDQTRYAMCFESYVFRTLIDTHMKKVPTPIKLIERSIHSAYYCFTHLLKASGVLSEPEFAVLSDWYKCIKYHFPIKVDAVVYLQTTPDVAHERVKIRNREEEGGLSLKYLTDLPNVYEDWLVQHKYDDATPVVYVDANCSMQRVKEKYTALQNILQEGCRSSHIETTMI